MGILYHNWLGVLDENSRVKCLNTNVPPGWAKSSSNDLYQLGLEVYEQRALNDTIPPYSYEQSWLLLVQNGEQMSELFF